MALLGPLSKGNFRRKMTTIVDNRGQLRTSTLSPDLLSPHLDFPDLSVSEKSRESHRERQACTEPWIDTTLNIVPTFPEGFGVNGTVTAFLSSSDWQSRCCTDEAQKCKLRPRKTASLPTYYRKTCCDPKCPCQKPL